MAFCYTPLEHPESDLRLVTIMHGQHDEVLSCILQTRRVQMGSDKYQALSYTWGDITTKVPILLNDKTFFVTSNLRDALQNLRCTTAQDSIRQLPLWIDAICINQEDSDERDEQVRRMKWIYQEAERVVIWLGNYNEPSDENVRLDSSRWDIDRAEGNSESTARSALILAMFLKQEEAQHSNSEVSVSLEDCFHSHNFQVWLQLSRLFRRPWFERLWVIQELAVSSKAVVLWGKLQTPWSTLEEAAKFILRPGDAVLSPEIRKIFPNLGAHRITQVSPKVMLNVDTQNILTVLHNTQYANCSDPRDRLYAILGIVEDNQDIEIDYSIPVQQVYRYWAEKRMRRTQMLDILSACADSSRGCDLPSWVPDLRRPFGQDTPLWMATLVAAKETEGVQCRDLHFSDHGLRVTLSGKYVGKIGNLTSVGDVVTDLPDPTDLEARLKQIIRDWEETLRTPHRVWQDEALAPKGFEETLLRSFYPWSKDSSTFSMPYKVWRGGANASQYLENCIAQGWWDLSRHGANLRDFERALFPRVHGCQMFTVENGRTGIVAGNCETRIGDELWLLSGGFTAFVLRRLNEAEHRLISPCYLFGKMYCVDPNPTAPTRHDVWQKVTLV